jgi:hypothetical protein
MKLQSITAITDHSIWGMTKFSLRYATKLYKRIHEGLVLQLFALILHPNTSLPLRPLIFGSIIFGWFFFNIICTVYSLITYSQTNKCTTITNKVYLAAPTYVSASNLPSSGGRPKNHSYSKHPTTPTFSITIEAHMPLMTLKWNWHTHSHSHTIFGWFISIHLCLFYPLMGISFLIYACFFRNTTSA